jgi:hypothetical protein
MTPTCSDWARMGTNDAEAFDTMSAAATKKPLSGAF